MYCASGSRAHAKDEIQGSLVNKQRFDHVCTCSSPSATAVSVMSSWLCQHEPRKQQRNEVLAIMQCMQRDRLNFMRNTGNVAPTIERNGVNCNSLNGFLCLAQALFNPSGSVVKMFLVPYNLNDMPPNSQTFIRQRTLYLPKGASDKDIHSTKYLRYLIHLR